MITDIARARRPDGSRRLLPLLLDLNEQPVLVIGADAEAADRLPALLAAGARVTVIAPEATDRIRELHDAGELRWLPREFRDSDVLGHRWVVSTSRDPELNRSVRRSAGGWSIPVHVAAAPHLSDFHFSAA